MQKKNILCLGPLLFFFLSCYLLSFLTLQQCLASSRSTKDLPNVLELSAFSPKKTSTQKNSERGIAKQKSKQNSSKLDPSRELLQLIQRRSARASSVEKLLQKGASPYFQNHFGASCVHEAVIRDQRAALRLMLLHSPQAAGCREKYTLETPLHIAAIMGKQDILELLLTCPIDINARDTYGRTALFCASNSSQTSCLLSLLRHGADPYIPDHKRRFAFAHASFYNQVRWLVSCFDSNLLFQ